MWLARHGVFLGGELGHAVVNVDQGEVGDHRLVHAVEGEEVALGAPEEAFVDAELVAVYAQAVLEFAGTVGRHLEGLAVGALHEEVPVLHVGQVAGGACGFQGLGALGLGLGPDYLLRLPVIEEAGFGRGEHALRFLARGEGLRHEAVALAPLRRVERGIDFVEGEEHLGLLGLLSFLVGECLYLLHVEFHEAVAPEVGVEVLGLQLPIAGTAPHQFVECELLRLLCHSGECEEQCHGCAPQFIQFHSVSI